MSEIGRDNSSGTSRRRLAGDAVWRTLGITISIAAALIDGARRKLVGRRINVAARLEKQTGCPLPIARVGGSGACRLFHPEIG